MKISIVTPSYNQAAHLEQTIQSVLLAADGCGAELEYVVIDGGSTDGSREILECHAHRFDYWCSEKDGGQYAAINKGFDKTSGEIMGWLNSSDLYFLFRRKQNPGRPVFYLSHKNRNCFFEMLKQQRRNFQKELYEL